jgi:hypothetical protein
MEETAYYDDLAVDRRIMERLLRECELVSQASLMIIVNTATKNKVP